MEDTIRTIVLVTGWPTLTIMSVLIIVRARQFYQKLQGTVVGRLIIPTVFGWLFGMYALGFVSTCFMLGHHWYYCVIPTFGAFLIAIIIVYRAIIRWQKEATELQAFYINLEKLVEERTKELEKAHKKELLHEKEIQKLKDQFVFIAAHELKTPVTSMRWAIEMALEEENNEKLSKELREQLEIVDDSNKRLINLVNDLLNVARIEVGTIKVELKSVNLNEEIEKTIKEMGGVFKKKGVTVTYEPALTPTVKADSERLKQVLINLLSNATKYNKKDGKIDIIVKKDGRFVRVAVKDTGIGIKKEDLKKLFKKFSRIEDDQTADVEGTGLGLYVTKEIVEKMGGKITATSTYRKGSTFMFTIPLATSA